MLKLFSQFQFKANINQNLSINMRNMLLKNKSLNLSQLFFCTKTKGKEVQKKKFNPNIIKKKVKGSTKLAGTTTFIHKSPVFNNNYYDKKPVLKEEIMRKTIKKLNSIKNQKENKLELEKNKNGKTENTTSEIVPEEKKTKKIRPRDIVYSNPIDALKALRIEEEIRNQGKDQTIDFVLKLDVKEAKKGQGQVRGLVTFPGGAIRAPRLCVFTSKDLHEVAKNAGADVIGDSTIIKNILDGKSIPFKKCLATTDSISVLKNTARILGPKGLMPNSKGGTLVDAKDLEAAVREIKAGKKEFRINPDNTIRLSIGKKSYTDDNLFKNIDSVCNAIYDSKPEGIRNFLVWAFLFPGQGRVYRLNIQSLIPVSDQYFNDDYQAGKNLKKEDKKEETKEVHVAGNNLKKEDKKEETEEVHVAEKVNLHKEDKKEETKEVHVAEKENLNKV